MLPLNTFFYYSFNLMVWCIGICFKTVGRTKEFLLLCNARNIFFFKSKNKKKKKLLHPKMIIINKPMTTWLKATCFTSEQRKVCYTSEFNKYIFFSLDELPAQTHFPSLWWLITLRIRFSRVSFLCIFVAEIPHFQLHRFTMVFSTV